MSANRLTTPTAMMKARLDFLSKVVCMRLNLTECARTARKIRWEKSDAAQGLLARRRLRLHVAAREILLPCLEGGRIAAAAVEVEPLRQSPQRGCHQHRVDERIGRCQIEHAAKRALETVAGDF